MYLTRAATLYGIEDLMLQYSVDPEPVLLSSGIAPTTLKNLDELISFQLVLDVLEGAAARCNRPIFGLELGMRQGLKILGVVGAYMSRQETIAQALKVAANYTYLHAQSMTVKVKEISSERHSISPYHNLRDYHLYPQKAQLSLAVTHRLMADLIGPSWKPICVNFTQPKPVEHALKFQQVFQCPVDFNCQADTIEFHPHFLKKQPRQDISLIDRELGKQLITTNATSTPLDLITSIEHAMKILLPSSECSKDNVAKCINVHPKKLQRFLTETGTSYRELLEGVRKRESLNFLRLNKMDIPSLALHLGYAESSVFSRQFKKWYGVPPSQWSLI